MRASACLCPAGQLAITGVCRPLRIGRPGLPLPVPVPGREVGVSTAVLPGLPPVRRGAPPDRRDNIPPNAAVLADSLPDEVVVSVPLSASDGLEQALAQAFGIELLERTASALTGNRVARYRVRPGQTVAAALAALQADPRVVAAQFNHVYRTQGGGTAAPIAGLQYAPARIDAPAANRIARGRGVIVAVIDSAIDRAHPDLFAAVIDEFPGETGAKGVVDGHGTAIAGIIGGRGDVVGIAPDSRMLGVGVFAAGVSGAPASAHSFGLLAGLDWSVAKGARVLNLSFTGPSDELIRTALRGADAKGVVIVAAAGNGGGAAAAAYPAAYAEVIAVTATDALDRLYDRANRGHYIAVAAPGVDVLAPTGRGGRDLQTGTSFAAAHVSGLIALMLEIDPDLTARRVRELLMAGAVDLGPPGFDEQFGAGRVNALATLTLMQREAPIVARQR